MILILTFATLLPLLGLAFSQLWKSGLMEPINSKQRAEPSKTKAPAALDSVLRSQLLKAHIRKLQAQHCKLPAQRCTLRSKIEMLALG